MVNKIFPLTKINSLFNIRNHPDWWKGFIVSGVLLFSALFAYVSSPSLITFTILLVVGLGVSILFLRHPPVGLLALVFASMLVPSPFSSGGVESINTSILLVSLLIGLWVFDMIARQRNIRLIPSKTNLPLLFFIVIAGIAFINGQIRYYNFAQLAPLRSQLGGWAIFFLSVGAFLLVANQIGDTVWLKRLTWMFLILSGVYILGRLIPPLERFIRPLYQYGSDASLFWIWLISLTSGQLLINRQLNIRWKFVLAGLIIATLYIAIVKAYIWKSGWLPPLVSLFVILWLSFPRIRLPVFIIGILLIITDFTGLGAAFAGGEDYSILTRFDAWRIILEIVKVNPILGLGPSNYYWYTPLFPILGYAVNFNSHNNYIDIFAQTGIVGLVCFLWFAWEVGRLGWKLKEIVPEGFEKAYVIGVFGGLIGTLVAGMLGDWILPFVYNVGLAGFRSSVLGWLFLGGLVVLERKYVRLDSK